MHYGKGELEPPNKRPPAGGFLLGTAKTSRIAGIHSTMNDAIFASLTPSGDSTLTIMAMPYFSR